MNASSASRKALAVAGYADTPFLEKLRLFDEVEADARYPDYLYGCYECGICVAACPSARFYDFSPRRIAQAAAREDVELMYQQMEEDIWECSQCFSCVRCPRGNNPTIRSMTSTLFMTVGGTWRSLLRSHVRLRKVEVLGTTAD